MVPDLVVGQGVAESNVPGVLRFGDHAGRADCVRMVVDLMPIQPQPGSGIALQQALLGDREHAAGAGSGVVDRPDRAGLEAGRRGLRGRSTLGLTPVPQLCRS